MNILLETEIFPNLIQIGMNKNNIIPTQICKMLLKERYYMIQHLHFSSSGNLNLAVKLIHLIES